MPGWVTDVIIRLQRKLWCYSNSALLLSRWAAAVRGMGGRRCRILDSVPDPAGAAGGADWQQQSLPSTFPIPTRAEPGVISHFPGSLPELKSPDRGRNHILQLVALQPRLWRWVHEEPGLALGALALGIFLSSSHTYGQCQPVPGVETGEFQLLDGRLFLVLNCVSNWPVGFGAPLVIR